MLLLEVEPEFVPNLEVRFMRDLWGLYLSKFEIKIRKKYLGAEISLGRFIAMLTGMHKLHASHP